MSKMPGFTLIELSLAIAFISILSLAVVLVITDTISSYRRGLTLNQVNTVGTDIVDDMMIAVQNSPAENLKTECRDYPSAKEKCEKDNGQKFVVIVNSGSVEVDGKSIGDSLPLSGAFCTGRYSYLWNSGYLFSNDVTKISRGKAEFVYEIGSSSDKVRKEGYRLLKVQDEERAVCKSAIGTNYDNISDNLFDISGSNNILSDEPIELLSGNNLALYDLNVSTPVLGADEKNLFYPISFIIGTLQGGINIKAASDNCVPPADQNSSVENFDYCSINKFNFAAQAIGGK